MFNIRSLFVRRECESYLIFLGIRNTERFNETITCCVALIEHPLFSGKEFTEGA